MHHRIDTILKRLRQDVAGHLGPESIRSACHQAGHSWRQCILNPVAIVHWFVIQVLHSNTSLEHVARLGGGLFTGSAFCLARAHLPLAVFQIVLQRVVQALIPDTQAEGRWLGHRTFLVDGSAFSMPDTPELQNQFGQPGAQTPGCGFPVAKILALFHAGTGVLLKVMVTPLRSHEMASVRGIHPALESGDVLVGDRGFCSYAHLAILVQGGIHAVFRMHQRQIVDFTPNRSHALPGAKKVAKGLPRSRWLRSLGVLDQVVQWFKPEGRPEWMTAEQYEALPETLTVRELRYEVGRPGFRTRTVTLVTTLLDDQAYPLEALAELYGTRWRVERRAKQTPPQATGGARPPAPVTIKVAALLELAAWCRQHRIELPGETPCPPPIDSPLPPAPDDHVLANDDHADRLGSTPERPSASTARPPRPTPGQAPGGHSRPGGRS